ncbi:uncharacterized protein BDW70DRAFT_145513 [Aspergillus foveolatus]|uniref:uncharacterized protein n=1 Tax=Aspergillus foveolatus TaxID=210207 RepID=UPI003CCD29C1
MTTAMSTNTSGSSAGSTTNSGYRFDGEATTDFSLWSQTFAFNVSGVCSGWSSTNAVLYSGGLIRPISNHSDSGYDWITNITAPDTAISGLFDEEMAQVRLSSAFSAARARDRKIVGRRSDQLVLGRETPDWNATLGFARGSVAGVEDGGSRGLGILWALSLTGFVGILLAI